MRFDTFALERNQTLFENGVEINLTESGVHGCTIREILDTDEIEQFLELRLGYGFTDGRPGLRAAIAQWHPGASAANVLVTNGSAEANLIALMTLLDAGDEIVFFVPSFMQISGLARALGLDVKHIALDADDGFQPDFDRLEAAIGPRTRAITVTNPANPTGTVLSQASRRRLVALAGGRNLWLLADEIYRGAEIDGPETASLWAEGQQVVVTGGLSKAFACPGLRLGWLIAPPDVISEAARRQDYTSIGSGILSQALAEKIMQPARRERVLGRGRSLLATNVSCLAAWLDGRKGWSWVRPAAGGMAFVRYGYDIPSEDFSCRLRQKESVFVAAGSWFGLDGHIRIATGVETPVLAEGLARTANFVRRTFGS